MRWRVTARAVGASCIAALICAATPVPLRADDATALAIGKQIQAAHTPFGLLFDVVYTDADSRERLGYIGYGDAALWTGLYLAADAYRYAVTRSPDALASARRSLVAIDRLSRISGDGLLARYYYAIDDPFVGFFRQDRAGAEYHEARLDGRDYYYVTRTSRDQYAGVFFGLGAAFDLLDDPDVRAQASTITTRLVDHLVTSEWHIRQRDGGIHDTFLHRPEQRLSILQLAAHVNPERFAREYARHRGRHSRFAWLGVLIDVIDADSAYFKFNLDHLYFYNLLRLEPKRTVAHEQYTRAYRRMREAVRDHANAHFNMIDRVLSGPDAKRDRETADLLAQMPARGLRQRSVDSRGVYKACGENRACQPLPVAARAYTDFLWQRHPFRLHQPGDPRIEHSGLDYILPYWMARYYDVVQQF